MLPDSFFCPASQNLLTDPLVDKEGRSIDRSAAAVREEEYIPNHAIKSAIGEYMERATEALPVFETAALNEKLEEQAASIAGLNQAKSQIEEHLRRTHMEISRIKLAASTLGGRAPASLSRAPKPEPFGSLRSDSEVHWLLLMSQLMRRHDLTDDKRAFEDVEDDFEDIVERRGRTRRKALARWVARRPLRTPAEEQQGQGRHGLRSSLLQLIRRSRPAGSSSATTATAAAQSGSARGAKIDSSDGHEVRARARRHHLMIMDMEAAGV